jgi:hypothetical protein
MKKTALAIVALLGLSSTADAQDHARRPYLQRSDPYAQIFSYWASVQVPDGVSPIILIRGQGIVVGTRIRCNVCGTAGHTSCGANVPLFATHYSWDMMP